MLLAIHDALQLRLKLAQRLIVRLSEDDDIVRVIAERPDLLHLLGQFQTLHHRRRQIEALARYRLPLRFIALPQRTQLRGRRVHRVEKGDLVVSHRRSAHSAREEMGCRWVARRAGGESWGAQLMTREAMCLREWARTTRCVA